MEKDEIEATAYVMDIKETTFAAEKKGEYWKCFILWFLHHLAFVYIKTLVWCCLLLSASTY